MIGRALLIYRGYEKPTASSSGSGRACAPGVKWVYCSLRRARRVFPVNGFKDLQGAMDRVALQLRGVEISEVSQEPYVL